MTRQEDLLKKYYKGETTLEEEKTLMDEILSESSDSVEKDVFSYFQNESYVPGDLEESILSKLEEKQQKGKTFKTRMYSIISAAAVILVILSVYLDLRKTRNEKLENDFFVMEQALYQVSECLQPEEQEEMMVLWVDNNVEIIIN
jgi:hypothetical protein